MNIVIDTNVLYSALLSRRGTSYKIISSLPNPKFNILLSVPLYTEYQDVLSRERLSNIYTKDEILGFLRYFCKLCKHLDIFYLWRPILRDPKDDMVLELAVAGNCDYIVTHNIRDFTGLDNFKPKIVTPKEFVRVTGD